MPLPSKRFRFPVPSLHVSQLRQVENLAGPAGALEAVLNMGAPDAPMAAVICHPYPPAGGTLHNKVVYQAMKALNGLGLPVLRFNFRGVGRSTGTFDNGAGEQDDVRSAVRWAERHLGLPVLLGGFSFGGYVALRGGCGLGSVVGRFALGLPWESSGRSYRYDFLHECEGPLLILNGDHDPFMSLEQLHAVVAPLLAKPDVEVVPGAEHFFQGVPTSPEAKLAAMRAVLTDWVLKRFS